MKHKKIGNKVKHNDKLLESKPGHKIGKVIQKGLHDVHKMKSKAKAAVHHKYPKH